MIPILLKHQVIQPIRNSIRVEHSFRSVIAPQCHTLQKYIRAEGNVINN